MTHAARDEKDAAARGEDPTTAAPSVRFATTVAPDRLAGAALLALAGCKTVVVATAYATDIARVAAGETLPADLRLALQLSSEEDCIEHGEAIAAAYATAFSEVSLGTCERIDFDMFLTLEVVTDFLPVTAEAQPPARPIALGARATEAGIEVLFLANPDASRAVWDALPEDLTEFQTFKVEPELFAVIQNDGDGPAVFTINAVFADDVPWPGEHTLTLDRREQAALQLSDVSNRAFGAHGEAVTIAVMKPD